MKRELLRLKLQFFAGEIKEEEDEVIIPGEEGVTGSSGVTGSTPPAYIMPQNTVAAPIAQDFDTWYKANGGMDEAGYYAKYDLDPDRDYQNTVNTLNYEYQTSMANYGEQAEKMYQMGLQNSGVSDIFQANAFSSYLGNMNQAAADRITARKKNKAAFNDYVAGMRAQHGQYETGIKTDYDTKLNSALTYAMSKYNGYNLQDVLNELGVSGYYTEIVDEVGKRLSGMDATSLQATTETVLAQDIINNISGFTGSENDLAAAKSMYGGMYGEEVIGKAFERAKTIYQNSAAGQDAILNGYIDQYYGNYTGDINTLDLSGIEDEGMREKVKTGIQQRFEADKTSLMSEILKLYPNYTASADENATIDAMFGNKYGANVLAAAKSALESLYKSGEGYENTQVQGFIDQYYGNYTGDINTLDLSGIEDEGMREKVKKGIEEKFRAQVGKAITAIGNWLNANGVDYSGTSAQKDAIKAALGFEYGTNELEYALSQYDTFGTYAKEEYANSPEGIQAKADEYVTKYGASFDPNVDMDTFIEDVIGVNTTDKDSADYKAAKAAWEQMSADYAAKQPERVQAIVDTFGIVEGKIDPSSFESKEAFINEMKNNNHSAKDAEAAWDIFDEAAGNAYNKVWAKYQAEDNTGALINTYTGNTKQKLDIKNLLGADVPEYIYNEIIKRMDANRAEEKEADKQDTLAGIEDLPEDEVNYNTLYNEIQNSGNDPDIRAASSVKLEDAVMGVLNDDSGEKLANAYELIPNMTKQTWDTLDDAGKLDALLNGIGEAHKNNVLTAADYNNVIVNWAIEEVKKSDIEGILNVKTMLEKFAYSYGFDNSEMSKVFKETNISIKNVDSNMSGSGVNSITIMTNKGNVTVNVSRDITSHTVTDNLTLIASSTDKTIKGTPIHQVFKDSKTNEFYYLNAGQYFKIDKSAALNLISYSNNSRE